ncbi:hypothetical protein C8J56DRAFT_798918, partial [Mycena floridula]
NETLQDHLVCKPFGACEACPPDSLQEPFCQPFRNRHLLHCMNTTEPSPSPLEHSELQHPAGEALAWESCGRIVKQERADFYEFVACNVLFVAVALAILFARSRRLEMMHARQLAARIGLVRGGLVRAGIGGCR